MVIGEVGELIEVIFPDPLINVQVPVPTFAGVAFKVAVFAQICWSTPAFGMIGFAETLITTVSLLVRHAPLLTVQIKLFAPTESPLIWSNGFEASVNVAFPLFTVQLPVPIAGAVAVSTVVVPQRLWSIPAFASDGSALLVIVTSAKAEQVPFVTVHLKTFAPTGMAVITELNAFAFEIVPPPEINVQIPVPTAGLFPCKVVDVAQICWSEPALTFTTGSSTLIVTWSVVEGQTPFVIVKAKTLFPVERPVTSVLN